MEKKVFENQKRNTRVEENQQGTEIQETQTLTIEEKEKIINKHKQAIEKIAKLNFYDEQNLEGVIDDVAYTTILSTGKQQKVVLLRLTFREQENTTVDIVVRPIASTFFRETYEKNDIIKKHFPHIFFSYPGNKFSTGAAETLIVERIEGYEEKYNGEKFDAFIENSKNFENLCRDIFEIIDEVFNEPFMLEDINAPGGHNIIFNKVTEKFQLFDVATLLPSDLPFEEKMMRFIINHITNKNIKDKDVVFVMSMIQRYEEKYTIETLTSEYETTVINAIEFMPETPPIQQEGLTITQTLHPDDPQYTNEYTRHMGFLPNSLLAKKFRKNITGTDDTTPLPIHILEEKKLTRNYINPKLITAIMQNNFEEAKQIIEKTGGELFIEETVTQSDTSAQ